MAPNDRQGASMEEETPCRDVQDKENLVSHRFCLLPSVPRGTASAMAQRRETVDNSRRLYLSLDEPLSLRGEREHHEAVRLKKQAGASSQSPFPSFHSLN